MSFSADVFVHQTDRTIQAIFDYAARIGREQQLDELVRLNADFARDLAGADRASLWLIDKAHNELWTRVAHGVDPIRIPLGQGLVGACIREDKVLLANDAAHESRLLRQVDSHSGYHTEQVLCVPLRTEGKVIGALQLLNKPSGFTETDAALMGLLAHFSASAIESELLRQEADSARLVKLEVSLARDVQARLLPQCPPQVEGIDCVGFCRPAHSIGGDYYDLLPLSDGRFALTLGDVSGKGVPAAVMMASIQTLLRSLLTRDLKSLPKVMADLNHALYLSSTAERYSTLFCGVVSADRTQFSYINAGHVPPFLLHPDGRVDRLEGGGPPVAMMPEWKFEEIVVGFQPGDTLVVVSDGIPESSNHEGDFWEEKEVERTLLAHLDAPLSQLPELLCAGADRFAAGAEQYDDMTVAALRVR
jgi:sigma-B regulation protein RsbU (phosphoserine phosphatase)